MLILKKLFLPVGNYYHLRNKTYHLPLLLPYLKELDGRRKLSMPPKRMSTFEAPAMIQAAIKKLVADNVTTALEAQATNMENTNNTTRPRETLVAIVLEDCKVKFATGTLTKEALSLVNFFAQPFSILNAASITSAHIRVNAAQLLLKNFRE
ncbi:hypothetical protein Tco_0497478 [Tanacetum coccineum]